MKIIKEVIIMNIKNATPFRQRSDIRLKDVLESMETNVPLSEIIQKRQEKFDALIKEVSIDLIDDDCDNQE